MSKIILVTELFYPDRCTTAHILTKIASKLSEFHDVTVICGSPGYDGTQISTQEIDLPARLKIIRVGGKNTDKNNIIKRTLKFITLSIALTNTLGHEYKKGDEVFIVTNPAPLMVMVSALKRVKHFPLTILIHDVFPENTIPAGLFKSSSNLLYKTIRSVFNRAYSTADRLIVLGRDMKDVMHTKLSQHKHQPEISIIENWADNPSGFKTNPSTGKIDILYAGNIGRVQGLTEFIDTFISVNNPDTTFSLRGTGAILSKIQKNYPSVRYGGPYNKDNQFEILANCDIALVTLAKGMYGLGVPSKTYNILAAGKPILCIGDLRSEIALLVKEHNIGWCFAPEDSEGLKSFLKQLSIDTRPELQLKGAIAKSLAGNIYSEDNILQKYVTLYSKI